MTETQQIRKKYKVLYKGTFVGVITLIQAISFLLVINLYLHLFPFSKSSMGMGISLYFYSYFVFPMALILGNAIAMFVNKRIYLLIYTILVFVALMYYWGGGILGYPYKIGFIILSSIGIYGIGILAVSRIRDWIS